MLSEVTIRCKDIKKIKNFGNAIVFYTKNNLYVCKSTQSLPNNDDIFITLKLKDKCDN